MSDEHSDEISGRAGDPPLVDPALFWREDVRRVLAALDVGGLYRVLGAGVSQRQIAALAGQSQSEVSEIVAGRRRVESHQVLVRIAEGFAIPRELMGLSWWGPKGTYCGEVPVAETPPEEEGADVRRRVLIATTTMVALGQVVQELAELALPAGESLPLRLGMSHVQAVAAVTERLRGVDATGCFTRALHVAHQVGDGFGIANAAWHAGATMLRSGHPNDALKCFQLGGFRLGEVQLDKSSPAILRADDPRVPTLTAWLKRDSAVAYALLGVPDQAKRCLAEAREGWAPCDAFERGEMDLVTAGILIDLSQFDTAEQLAASAVRTYGEGHRVGRTHAELMLAEVHVRAGEPRGLMLARQAIDAVSTLQSVSARQERVVPLTAALEARPGSEAKEITRMARQVAATPGVAGPQ